MNREPGALEVGGAVVSCPCLGNIVLQIALKDLEIGPATNNTYSGHCDFGSPALNCTYPLYLVLLWAR